MENKTGCHILREIGAYGRSEPKATCEALGGKGLRVSRETGCDLLTCEGNSRATQSIKKSCPTVSWFRIACSSSFLWCRTDKHRDLRRQQRAHKERRRAAVKHSTLEVSSCGSSQMRASPVSCPKYSSFNDSLERDCSTRKRTRAAWKCANQKLDNWCVES